jgi:hypothetical protein
MPTLADANAFFMPTVTEIVFMDTVAAAATTMTPSTAEITSGLKLMNELYDVSGFTGDTTWITRRGGGSRVDTQLAGKYTYAGSYIDFTADRAGNDAAAEFAVDPEDDEAFSGFLLCAWRGLVTGRPAKIFKVEVAPTVELPSMDGSDYMRVRIPFGIQKAKDIVLPTLP